jgi:N utilization substance protein B
MDKKPKAKTKKNVVILPVKRTIKGSAKARRNAARLAAVQCVYQMQQNGMSAEQILGDYVNNRLGLEEDGQIYVAADTDSLRSILVGVETNKAQLIEMLDKTLNEQRNLARQEQILQSILLCGAEELFAHHDVDTALIISGYVEVAKAFYEGREPAMINATLDSLAKVLRATA